MYCSNCGTATGDRDDFCSSCGTTIDSGITPIDTLDGVKEVRKGIRARINRMERVALSGGLIGCLATNPREALESKMRELNAEGWNCRQMLDHSTHNSFIKILQFLVLICTLGLWTFGAGYLLLFEKER